MADTGHAAQQAHPAHPAHEPHARPEQVRPERVPPHTHTLNMTTREKCLLETMYPVEVMVENGKAVVVSAVDATHAWVIAADAPGNAHVSVTPLEPNEDYVPAVVRVEVNYPRTDLVIGPVEPK